MKNKVAPYTFLFNSKEEIIKTLYGNDEGALTIGLNTESETTYSDNWIDSRALLANSLGVEFKSKYEITDNIEDDGEWAGYEHYNLSDDNIFKDIKSFPCIIVFHIMKTKNDTIISYRIINESHFKPKNKFKKGEWYSHTEPNHEKFLLLVNDPDKMICSGWDNQGREFNNEFYYLGNRLELATHKKIESTLIEKAKSKGYVYGIYQFSQTKENNVITNKLWGHYSKPPYQYTEVFLNGEWL